jgi:hypothetical protein
MSAYALLCFPTQLKFEYTQLKSIFSFSRVNKTRKYLENP